MGYLRVYKEHSVTNLHSLAVASQSHELSDVIRRGKDIVVNVHLILLI